MYILLQVMLAGGVGAGARYAVGLVTPFPYGTLTVNVVGSFLIGLAFATLAARNHPQYLMLTTGFLGGFTTFSAFSLDTFKLVERGAIGPAAAYVAATFVLSVGACFLAIWWART